MQQCAFRGQIGQSLFSDTHSPHAIHLSCQNTCGLNFPISRLGKCRHRAAEGAYARAEADRCFASHDREELRECFGAWKANARRCALLRRRAKGHAAAKAGLLTARAFVGWRERTAALQEARAYAEHVSVPGSDVTTDLANGLET